MCLGPSELQIPLDLGFLDSGVDVSILHTATTTIINLPGPTVCFLCETGLTLQLAAPMFAPRFRPRLQYRPCQTVVSAPIVSACSTMVYSCQVSSSQPCLLDALLRSVSSECTQSARRCFSTLIHFLSRMVSALCRRFVCDVNNRSDSYMSMSPCALNSSMGQAAACTNNRLIR